MYPFTGFSSKRLPPAKTASDFALPVFRVKDKKMVESPTVSSYECYENVTSFISGTLFFTPYYFFSTSTLFAIYFSNSSKMGKMKGGNRG